jgi:hypothetical protein
VGENGLVADGRLDWGWVGRMGQCGALMNELEWALKGRRKMSNYFAASPFFSPADLLLIGILHPPYSFPFSLLLLPFHIGLKFALIRAIHPFKPAAIR